MLLLGPGEMTLSDQEYKWRDVVEVKAVRFRLASACTVGSRIGQSEWFLPSPSLPFLSPFDRRTLRRLPARRSAPHVVAPRGRHPQETRTSARMAGFRMLDLVRPFLPLIPEVSAPDRKVSLSRPLAAPPSPRNLVVIA